MNWEYAISNFIFHDLPGRRKNQIPNYLRRASDVMKMKSPLLNVFRALAPARATASSDITMIRRSNIALRPVETAKRSFVNHEGSAGCCFCEGS